MLNRRTLKKTRDAIDTILAIKSGPAELKECFARCHVDGERAIFVINALANAATKQKKMGANNAAI